MKNDIVLEKDNGEVTLYTQVGCTVGFCMEMSTGKWKFEIIDNIFSEHPKDIEM